MMGRVIHFEITADDPDRAAEFYRKAFGWEISDFGGPFKYLLVTTGPADQAGINGAITSRSEHAQSVINSISVDRWEDGAQAVEKAGGRVLMEKTPIAGIGYFAYCRDTEGNVFGIVEEEPAAMAGERRVPAGQAVS
jgi:predicted enzyme related to lactoylglutathione lyase